MRIAQLKGGDDYRLYQVHNENDSHITNVRVWNDGPEILVSTTIGGPSKVTSGVYRSDDDAIAAHFKPEPHEDQLRALARGIDEGWHAAEGLQGSDALPSIWIAAREWADQTYPNGWRGGESASECRAAYIGGWAIGVQRYADGVLADGSTVKLDDVIKRRPGVDTAQGYTNTPYPPSMPSGGIDS